MQGDSRGMTTIGRSGGWRKNAKRKESVVHEVHAKIWRRVLYFILFFGSGYLPRQHLQA